MFLQDIPDILCLTNLPYVCWMSIWQGNLTTISVRKNLIKEVKSVAKDSLWLYPYGYVEILKKSTYRTHTSPGSTDQVVVVMPCSSFLPVLVGYRILAQHTQYLLAYSNNVHKVLKYQYEHHPKIAHHEIDSPVDQLW